MDKWLKRFLYGSIGISIFYIVINELVAFELLPIDNLGYIIVYIGFLIFDIGILIKSAGESDRKNRTLLIWSVINLIILRSSKRHIEYILATLKGDIWVLMDLMEYGDEIIKVFTIFGIDIIAFLIYSIYYLIKAPKETPIIKNESVNTTTYVQDSYEGMMHHSNRENDEIYAMSQGKQSIKKEPVHKNNNKLLFVLFGLVVLIICIFIGTDYNQFSYKEEIEVDMTEFCTIEYDGNEGNAYAYANCDPEYASKKYSNEIEEALYWDVDYTIDPEYDLSNGDVITLTAVYSSSEMRNLHIKPINTTKEFVVEGLGNAVSSYDEYSEEIKQTALNMAEESLEEELKYGCVNIDVLDGADDVNIKDKELKGIYFAYEPDINSNELIYLYKVTCEYTKILNKQEKTFYCIVSIENMNEHKTDYDYAFTDTLDLSIQNDTDADNEVKYYYEYYEHFMKVE